MSAIKEEIILECRIVGAVCDIEDRRHLSGCVRFHLLEEGLEVDALRKKNQTSVKTKTHPTLASQNLISVIGPGFSPLFRSSAESLLNTSSVCKLPSLVFFIVLDNICMKFDPRTLYMNT